LKVFIAGAKGQLGHALQETLGQHETIAYDLDELDITQLEATRKVLEHIRPQVVINAAAYTKVDQAESEPEIAFRINALGPRNLALATDSLKIPLLQVSTDFVFDGQASRPYHEFDWPRPQSIYGMSKLSGEENVRVLNPRHFIVRTAWLYHTVGENFPKAICALADREEICVVNDQHGSPTYAPHLAQALSRLIETEAYGTYHIAGSGGTSRFDFARTLFTLCGIATKITPVSTAEFPRPASRPAHAVLITLQDPSIVLPPWEQGLQEFVQKLAL
jgi:dTDP-4-dehydrorhamnose reductase